MSLGLTMRPELKSMLERIASTESEIVALLNKNNGNFYPSSMEWGDRHGSSDDFEKILDHLDDLFKLCTVPSGSDLAQQLETQIFFRVKESECDGCGRVDLQKVLKMASMFISYSMDGSQELTCQKTGVKMLRGLLEKESWVLTFHDTYGACHMQYCQLPLRVVEFSIRCSTTMWSGWPNHRPAGMGSHSRSPSPRSTKRPRPSQGPWDQCSDCDDARA